MPIPQINALLSDDRELFASVEARSKESTINVSGLLGSIAQCLLCQLVDENNQKGESQLSVKCSNTTHVSVPNFHSDLWPWTNNNDEDFSGASACDIVKDLDISTPTEQRITKQAHYASAT